MNTTETEIDKDLDYPLDPLDRIADFLDWAEIKSSRERTGGYYTLVPAAKFSKKGT